MFFFFGGLKLCIYTYGNLFQFCWKILLCCFVGAELVYYDNGDRTSATMLPMMGFKGGRKLTAIDTRNGHLTAP